MTIVLQSVDSIEITVLVDNYTDLLLTARNEITYRPEIAYGRALLAEHGLSFLVRIQAGDRTHTILMDAGVSETTLFHNARELALDLNAIEEIVISHGHYDHMGALIPVLRSMSCRTPVHLHPEAFSQRRKRLADGRYTALPAPDANVLMHAGAILNLSSEPSLLVDRLMLLTGEIERTTAFEKGSSHLEVYHQTWGMDLFRDDQSLILHLAGKGLVILSGCAHAGIINSIQYARKITGVDQVHAVLGGFHLSGPYYESMIQPTCEALQEINPRWVIPMHCTGWEALSQFSRSMPDNVMVNTVGTRYVFASSG